MNEEGWALYASTLGWIRKGWADTVLAAIMCSDSRTGNLAIPRAEFLKDDPDSMYKPRPTVAKIHPGVFKFHFESNWFHRWVLTRGNSRPLIVTAVPDTPELFEGERLTVKILVQNLTEAPVSIYRMADGPHDLQCCNHVRWRNADELVSIVSDQSDWPSPRGIWAVRCSCSKQPSPDGVSPDPKTAIGLERRTFRIQVDPTVPTELYGMFTLEQVYPNFGTPVCFSARWPF